MTKKNEQPYLLLDPNITGITIPKNTPDGTSKRKMLARLVYSKIPIRQIQAEKPSNQNYMKDDKELR